MKNERINKAPQINPLNFLFDLRKIKCQLLFFNKEKNPPFFNDIKNLLIENLNALHSNNFAQDRKTYYLKFIEKNVRDIDEQREFMLDNQVGIYMFLTIVTPSLRQECVNNFENEIEKSKRDAKLPLLARCILIFFYDNDEELEKSLELKVKYPRNIFYVKTNTKNLDEAKIKTENQLYSVLLQTIIAGYKPLIESKQKLLEKIKYNKNTFDSIKDYIGGLLQIQDYDNAYKYTERCISEFSYFEKGYWEEVKALIMFYYDYMYSNEKEQYLKFNTEFCELMKDAKKRYKKEKKISMIVYNLYRQTNYYSFFYPDKIYDSDKSLIKLNKMLRVLTAPGIEDFFVHYLRISELYKSLKIQKKSDIYFLLAGLTCFKTEQLKNMLPFMINELKEKFNLYDVSQNLIETEDHFNEIHKCLVLSHRKPISFFIQTLDENNNIKYERTTKKKIEPKKKLSVKKNVENISKYIFKLFWKDIQCFLHMNIMQFFKDKHDFENCLIFSLSYLESMTGLINKKEQNKIMNLNITNSLLTQTRIFLNVSKLPLLMRIIPVTSNIRFDVTVNPNKKKKTEIFLYNPWEQNKFVNNNFYWTTNSYQQIRIQFYNPLDIELDINKIRILFKGNQPTVYPSSVNIPPRTSTFIVSKVHPNMEGKTNIIGVKYEIINTVGVQYVDDNGNGLFYNYENKYVDPTKAYINNLGNKKQLISLSNITIYPEIPKLSFKLLDDELNDENLTLFDNQLYNFRFQFENIGVYDIDKLTCYIYVYKANNYKITLDEITVTPNIKKNGGKYIFEYLYWHKNSYERIEFKTYYFSQEKIEKSKLEDDVLLKQYLYHSNNIETFHTFTFNSINVNPIIMSTDINELALIDKKITLNYSACFCSNKNYIGFLIENIHESKLEINIYDESSKLSIKTELIDGRKAKEISTEIRSESTLKDIVLKWRLIDLYKCEGKILLSDIIPYYDVNMWKKFTFTLSYKELIEKSIKVYNCFIKVKNNQKIKQDNLKFYIYIYQNLSTNEDEVYLYNNLLNHKIFVQGCLSLNINSIGPGEEFNYDIKIYPLVKEEFNVSCAVLDKEKKEVYFCPNIINLKV